MAGLRRAIEKGYVHENDVGILDSTAHMLKFISFQEKYFQDSFEPEFKVRPRSDLRNAPFLVKPKALRKFPEPGKPLKGEEMKLFIQETVAEIAEILQLKKR
jgi:threonine synthase